MTKPIRVLIADDHTIVRAGVRLLLEAEPDMEVIGEALTGDEAVAAAESLKPNVILMDISMPGLNGMEATGKIKTRFPEIQVLVLTMHRSDEYFFEVLKAGASGYVLKGAETNELIGAIRAVARGEVFLYPTMAKQLLQDYLSRVKGLESLALPALTPREKEILHLLADGYSNKEIAERLVVSPSTVHSHHSNLMKKLNLNSRHELIQFARQRGLLRDS
ncbi:MAG: response regulator transcription factor [Chloroflexi bacterium]|nr:response regulator transcription factor [Chloroflexota bacterium]MBI5828457.1 response regulator transcription factor [Chloroflexota bacterium]